MIKLREEKLKTDKGIIKQMDTLLKFKTPLREEFDELMKVMNHMQEVERKKIQLKEELKKLKGPKKNLLWKK
jgi:cell envelope opacity-associated protein A